MRNGSRGGTRKGGGGCGPPPSTPPPPPQGLFFSMVPIDSSSSAHTCRPHFSPFSFLCFVAIFFVFFSLFARARLKLQSPSEPDWCFSFYRWLTKKNKKQKQTNVESICNNQTADFQGNVSPKKRLSLFASQSSFLMNVSSITIDFDDEGLPCDQITLDPFNDQSVRSADGGNGVDRLLFLSFVCFFFTFLGRVGRWGWGGSFSSTRDLIG